MMGMDSLMAMELRNRSKTDLKIDIPVSQIMAGQNTVEIAHYLEEKLSESAVNSQIDKMPETTIEQLTEEELLNNLNELSDAQVVSLLSTMLTEEEEDID